MTAREGEAAAPSDVAAAEEAVALVYTDHRRARALAVEVRKRRDAGPEARAIALRALGMVAVARDDLGGASRLLRSAIETADGAGLRARAAEARASLSYVLTLGGKTTEALGELDRARPALRGVPAAQLLMQRGLILTEIGRFSEADAVFGRSLRALERAGGSLLIEGDVHMNRSLLHLRRHRWRAAQRDLARAEALYVEVGHGGRIAMVEENRGAVAVIGGDLPAAFAHYDEAERRYRAQGRDAGLIPVERAEALLSVRLVAEARAAAEVGVAAFERGRNAVDLVQARLALAQVLLADGDPGAAGAEAERARRSAHHQQRPAWVALATYVALRARWERGDRSAAMLRASWRALATLDDSGWVVAALDARLIAARVAIDLGRTETARQLLVETTGRRRDGPAEVRARAWHAEALLRLGAGDRRGAATALGAGMDVLDRFRASLGASELRAQVSSAAGDLARLGTDLAMRSGNARSVLRWAERWRAGAMLAPPARPPDDAALADGLAELRQVATEARAVAAGGGDPHSLLRRQAALEEAVRRRSRHVPGSDAGAGPTPTAGELAGALGPAALAEYLVHDGDLHVVVVAGRRVRLHRLGQADPATQALTALRFGLRRLAFGIGSPSSLAAAAILVEQKSSTLDELLLGPLRSEIGDGPLVVVPTGQLHAVPWAALPSCAGRPVSVAPSAALWYRAATAPDRSRTGRSVLAAGPGLPHAAAEIASLARRYRDAIRFTGRRARVDAVAAALDGADLAHIAAHGRFRADNPLFSAIELADGPLTVLDLERLGRPPLVMVLSACDSGLPVVHPGDELLGLAAAMLSMGTRGLVATVIPVPDDATRPLMLALHGHLRRGQSPATALASAQRDMAGSTSVRTRVAAAGFVCLGAG